jgi:hypothetical protein
MKQGIHRLWILLLTVLPWAGVSAGPALAAVQADLAREADRAAAEQAARQAAEASSNGLPFTSGEEVLPNRTHSSAKDSSDNKSPDSHRTTGEGRFVSAPSAIKPGDSDSNAGIDLALAGGASECDSLVKLERGNLSAGALVVAALHYPIYQAQAPPRD